MTIERNFEKGKEIKRMLLIPRIVKPRKIRGENVLTEKPKKTMVKPIASISEKEERLADFLEAAQEMKPLADGVTDDMAEERPMPQPEPLQEEIVEQAAIIPEEKHEETAIAVEQPRKKRHGRKGKKARAAMMAAEQELL